jgi:hypothetical protein
MKLGHVGILRTKTLKEELSLPQESGVAHGGARENQKKRGIVAAE